MIIDCISDLHGHYPKLEGGDLLIVAGDLTARDKSHEYIKLYEWLQKQEYRKKIIVPGNHDNYLQKCNSFSSAPFAKELATYLCDSGTEFEGLKIWGSPWTKWFEGVNPHCTAFMLKTEEELTEKWAMIPDDTDILITHGPPYGILDKNVDGEHVGSKSLALKMGLMETPPKLWVWGHIHEAYGRDLPVRGKPCIMLNASHVNERYEPVNRPVRIIL